MATISEDYVSFETAKLLKKKGFDELCAWQYYTYWEGEKLKSYKNPILLSKMLNNSNVIGRDNVTAPTLQMACKWLREVHDCPIEILWHWNANSQCSEWYFGHHMELKPLPRIQYYDTYEEATEAAIKYCLENLI